MPRGMRPKDPPPPPPPSLDEEVSSVGRVHERKMRQRFGHHEDYLLVRQVQLDAPYTARHGAIGETWDGIAEHLNRHPDFHMRPIKGTTAKTRFDTLVLRHRRAMARGRDADLEARATPYQKLMQAVVDEIERRSRGDARLGTGEDGGFEVNEDLRASCRRGTRRARSSVETNDVDAPAGPEIARLPRAMDTDHLPSAPGASVSSAARGTTVQETDPMAATRGVGPETCVGHDLVTVHQAMAELLKLQHAFATRPTDSGDRALEQVNEARRREEEERTKQRGLELQIEMQRTRRRQLELEFEKEERKKDREEQAKLIASLVERLEPKRN